MDLNIENYNIEEIYNILNIDTEVHDLTRELLYNKLQTKINQLRSTETSEISENKALLVDFFYQCYIKVNGLQEEKQNF